MEVWEQNGEWSRETACRRIVGFPYALALLSPFDIRLIFLFVAIGYILLFFTDSNVPWWDSFTTALSVIALWMLAHKYIEQWLVWIVIDVACCGIYVYKGLYFTAFLYGFYAVVAIFGYLKWKKMMQ